MGTDEGFDGSIDEVAIWNKALTVAEITALYNSGSGLNASSNSGNYTSSSNLQAYCRLQSVVTLMSHFITALKYF